MAAVAAGRVARLGWAWFGLSAAAALLAPSAPAQAQMECEAGAFLCATLTVGEDQLKGYWKTIELGDLSEDEFDISTNTFTVQRIVWAGPTGGTSGDGPRLHFQLDKDLPEEKLAVLALRIGTHDFPLAVAGRNNTQRNNPHNYRWQDPPSALRNAAENSTTTVQLLIPTTGPAHGAPTVTGSRRVGGTLAADTSGIGDFDGLTTATYGYQWIRVVATSTEADIGGATSQTYTPAADDLGKGIKVRVTFTDDGGNPETLTSGATAAIMDAAACERGGRWCETLRIAHEDNKARGYCDPTESGNVNFCDDTTYGRVSGDRFTLGGNDYTVYSVRWGGPGAADSEQSEGPRLHLTLDRDLPSEERRFLTLKVGAHEFALSSAGRSNSRREINDLGNYRWQNPPSARRNAAENSTTTVQLLDSRVGNPVIVGEPDVGKTLTADTSGITDADGVSTATYGYQWIRVAPGGTEADIDGATSQTYTPVEDDVGGRIRSACRVVSFT